MSAGEGTFVTPSPPKRQRDDVPAYPEQQGVYYEDEANGGYVEDDEGGDYEQGESTDDQQLPYYAHKEQQPPGHLAPPPQALKLPDDLLSEVILIDLAFSFCNVHCTYSVIQLG